MEKRLGVIGIVVKDRESAVSQVNELLSAYAGIVVGRMGIPYRQQGVAVIALIVDGSTDDIGALTGKLGAIRGIQVRSALTKK
ncbi:MAG TPA: TM1266 family iron-only hydrogenase system putative regulator [Atribacteraceae bacterium]|nr:TM1266 family iron-only hydrogenase system putative regulator [Atribacteraceae bacterium]